MIKKILISILLTSQALACDIPTKIDKGSASPCDGYVISPSTELKIRTDLVYKDALIANLTQINKTQDNIMKIDAEQLKIYASMEKESFWQKTFYFGLGSLVTGLVAYGTVRALK